MGLAAHPRLVRRIAVFTHDFRSDRTRTEEPILPLRLFSIKAFRVSVLASFVVSMAFLGVVMFMPLYMQVVQGINATQSGVALLPLMAGLIVSSTCLRTPCHAHRTLQAIHGWRRHRVARRRDDCWRGSDADTTPRDLAWRLAITGIGLGPAQNLFSLVIQTAAPMTELGTATSMGQFSRQIGSTVGVAIFGTILTHSLTVELPKRVPMLPGTTVQSMDLGHAQSQAMDVGRTRTNVDHALAGRLEVIERAYHEDRQAVRQILADQRLPEQIKAPLRDGGVRARVQRELIARADHVEAGLRDGEAGREALLQDPQLPAALRQHLANVPERAFGEEDLTASVIALFRASILSQENAMVAAQTDREFQSARVALDRYAPLLVEQIDRGMKETFSASIAHMLGYALWIVALGLLLILFIPELPLRTHHKTDAQAD